ncbi:MAG: hypothetical protein L3J65_10500 [Robiginitomaculum sp.]|nr:hypothetical protein [Robiginitomaculum sp.]
MHRRSHNLKVLGEPTAKHRRRERFGGTEKAVKWRAAFNTDGHLMRSGITLISGNLSSAYPSVSL